MGLPEGQMGNSEVGHMNIGAGRVVMQDLPRIDQAMADGSLVGNAVFRNQLSKIKAAGGALHVMGLLSPGGVHAHQDHMAALAKAASAAGVPVKVHAFLDGRDTPPSSARDYITAFQTAIAGHTVSIATVSGRYWAMDRDNRWDRVARAYAALVMGQGETAPTALAALDQSYELGKTDEFVAPTVIDGYTGMADGDGVIMANFRSDRARQVMTALTDPDFDGFARPSPVRFSAAMGMTEYSAHLNQFLSTLFPAQTLTATLGEIVSEAGLKQLRIAETEKYAHVTFFFNGGLEGVCDGEDRILVPSPNVATYDMAPEMSALEVTSRLEAAILSRQYDLIVVNYANGDMVGHTGNLAAAIKAVETVDVCLGRIEAAVIKTGASMLITADHGNAEQMRDPISGEPHTAHTTGPVDAILVNAPSGIAGLDEGRLADIAPTLLTLMGIAPPVEMTGRVLLQRVALDRPEAGARRAAG